MARLKGTLIANGNAYSNMSFAPTVDLRLGGQNGFIPDYRTYLSNSAYVQRNVIPFLIEYPRGFNHLPNPEIWIGTLKSLVETQALTIEGLNGKVNVSYTENAIGSSGEMQEDFTQVTRERSTPSFTWVERQGRPVHLFFNGWIFYLIGHPDTQTPMINALPQNADKYFDFLPDFNSMSVLFVEPDPFQRRVIEAWLCVNMMPKTSGDLNGKRDLASAMSDRKVTIDFTAMTMMSLGVNQFGQWLLNQLNYVGLNPHTRRSAIETISANITGARHEESASGTVNGGTTDAFYSGNIGYLDQVNDIATTQNDSVDGNGVTRKDINYNTSELRDFSAGAGIVNNPSWVLSTPDDKTK
jgi:major virion structural protein|nr:MAG TPA: virion structural protein [Caudoviricetes sp.]DAO09253.1 MAG TPA: virion structural protein [Caudoviricetes sp.]